MLLDDRPEYPVTCAATFVFEGHFDRDRLEEALREALERHPMFRAQIRTARGHGEKWVPAEKYPQVQWLNNAEAEPFEQATPIDLQQQAGLRMWVKQDRDTSELLFDFHHGCVDGAGGLLFIEDLLTLYAAKFDGHGTRPLPPPEFDRLLDRGRFEGVNGWSMKRIRSQVSLMPEIARFATQIPTPLQASTIRPMSLVPAPPTRRYATYVLSAEAVSELRETAVRYGATLNDLLIAALFLTTQEWNAKRGKSDANDWLRILMPANLRNRADLRMPAANRMSYAFLTQRATTVRDMATAMGAVSAETAKIRRLSLPIAFLSQLGIVNATRIGLPMVLSAPWCAATAVLSNVGDPTRRFRSRLPREDGLIVAGNVRMTRMNGITALRPLTRAAVFVNTYANQITMNARLDPNCFAQAETNLFLSCLMRHLMGSAATMLRIRAA